MVNLRTSRHRETRIQSIMAYLAAYELRRGIHEGFWVEAGRDEPMVKKMGLYIHHDEDAKDGLHSWLPAFWSEQNLRIIADSASQSQRSLQNGYFFHQGGSSRLGPIHLTKTIRFCERESRAEGPKGSMRWSRHLALWRNALHTRKGLLKYNNIIILMCPLSLVVLWLWLRTLSGVRSN